MVRRGLTDGEGARLEPLLPPRPRPGRPSERSMVATVRRPRSPARRCSLSAAVDVGLT
jgi:transposase